MGKGERALLNFLTVFSKEISTVFLWKWIQKKLQSKSWSDDELAIKKNKKTKQNELIVPCSTSQKLIIKHKYLFCSISYDFNSIWQARGQIMSEEARNFLFWMSKKLPQMTALWFRPQINRLILSFLMKK